MIITTVLTSLHQASRYREKALWFDKEKSHLKKLGLFLWLQFGKAGHFNITSMQALSLTKNVQ